ncbi:hypothetical protein LUZ62_056248 [Rhynchospora pubera]|uniref:Uncharacterized protein n=1 Tax=Rhynchospora pubera TaxID=906938 RepID=A0AAV8DYN4_9POAL|nr:hypothetical protein LUZ62_056248 [Rhynchospora pubera]
MNSKSGDILIHDEHEKRNQGSGVTEKGLQTESLLIQTTSSDNSTLTQTLEYEEEVSGSGCWTPTELIFDPFAPGSEELCLAPKRKNSSRNLRRQLSLNFDLSFPILDLEREFEELEKEEIQTICKSFLDLIISDVLEICEEKSSTLEDGFKTPTKMPLPTGFVDVLEICEEKSSTVEDGFKTPTKRPLLTGYADTCPGAPVRPPLKLTSILKSDLCRKLDFDSDLD